MQRSESARTFSVLLWAAAAVALAIPINALAMQDEERFEPDAKAAEAFEAMVTHYRELPAIETTCEIKIEMEQDGQTSAGETVDAKFIRSGDAGVLELRGFTCTIQHGTLYMVHESTDHSYYSEEFQDSPYWPLLMKFQDLPFPHLAMYWGEADMPDLWMQLHTKTPYLVPTKVETVTNEDGSKERLITLSSPNARMVIHQNPETKLIGAIDHEITGGMFVRDGAILRTRYSYEHVTHDNAGAAPQIAFETGGRQRVDFVAALVDQPPPQIAGGIGEMPAPPDDPAAALENKPAPPFDLPLLGEGNVKLEDLRGEVVVLDFWATWCPPCRKALPSLHEAAEQAKAAQLPVRVIAVNCWEHGDTNEARVKKAGDFWKSNEYTLPVAMDHDGAIATAYGVSGIPTTVVIGPDGVVHSYHVGAPPNYVEWLIGEIKDALEADGGEGDVQG